jgi:hypothetical protein
MAQFSSMRWRRAAWGARRDSASADGDDGTGLIWFGRRRKVSGPKQAARSS